MNIYFTCNFIRSWGEIQQTKPLVIFRHGFRNVLGILVNSPESVRNSFEKTGGSELSDKALDSSP